MTLLLKKVIYLSSPMKSKKAGCWTKSEQVLQNLIPPSNTDMQPFQITDGQTDPGLNGHLLPFLPNTQKAKWNQVNLHNYQ